MRHRERDMLCSARVAGEVSEKVETSSLIHSITKICGARSVPGLIPGMGDSAESKAVGP